MITANNARKLMTPGSLTGNVSEALPSNPHTGDMVVAINVGATFTYTLTGTIDGVSNLALAATQSAILVYTSGAGWESTWKSGGGSVSFPISIAHGGTGIDGTGLFDWTATAPGDSAVTAFTLSATDSNANKSTASWGIELPGDGVSPGDLVSLGNGGKVVVRSAVAQTAKVFEVQYPDKTPQFQLNGDAYGGLNFYGSGGVGFTSQGASNVPAASDPMVLTITGSDSAGNPVPAVFGTLDVATERVVQIAAGGMGATGVYLNDVGGIYVTDANGYVTPTATLDVLSTLFVGPSFRARSAANISGLFQTSITDGSNTFATEEILGNTLQAANLTNWRGTDGTTVVASVGIGGNVDAASYSVGGAAGATAGPFTVITGITVVGGIVTALTGT